MQLEMVGKGLNWTGWTGLDWNGIGKGLKPKEWWIGPWIWDESWNGGLKRLDWDWLVTKGKNWN